MIKEEFKNSPRLIIKNYKQFKSKTEIILSPVTILVGPNGEGKSSIMSALELFSNSLLYISNSVDNINIAIENISFKEVISYNSSNKRSFFISYINNQIEWIKFEYSEGENGGVKLDNFIQKINFPFGDELGIKEERLISIKVFPSEFDKYNKSHLRELEDKLEYYLNDLNYRNKWRELFLKFEDEIDLNPNYKFVRTEVVENESDNRNKYIDLIETLSSTYFSRIFRAGLLSDERKIIEPILYWTIILLSTSEKYFSEIVKDDSIILESLLNFYNRLDTESSDWFDLIFNRLDDTRERPPEFFEFKKGDIINDYYGICSYLLDSSEKYTNKTERMNREKLSNYIKKFEIGDRITLSEPIEIATGHKLYSIFITKGKLKFNLNNLSSGGKQILPIIINLFQNSSSNENILISQPELHLHPDLQAKIADLIVENIFYSGLPGKSFKYDVGPKIIVLETHSEHIIRKFQVLVAKESIRNTDISVHYLHKGKATFLPMNERGLFEEKWPDGFFPQSTTLTLDLVEELTRRQN